MKNVNDEPFIAFECGDVYPKYNIVPEYKYFACQSWHASFEEEKRQDIINEFKKCSAKWILVNKEKDTEIIQNILDNNYYIYDFNDKFILYCLK